MLYYKDINNKRYAFSEEDINTKIAKNKIEDKKLIEITYDEYQNIVNSKISLEDIKTIKAKELSQLRELKLSKSIIDYKDKQFMGNRETGLELDSYSNNFIRAVKYGERQETDVVASWRTNDNSYIDLYIQDIDYLALKCAENISIAFKKQEVIEPKIISCETVEELNNLDLEYEWDNI